MKLFIFCILYLSFAIAIGNYIRYKKKEKPKQTPVICSGCKKQLMSFELLTGCVTCALNKKKQNAANTFDR